MYYKSTSPSVLHHKEMFSEPPPPLFIHFQDGNDQRAINGCCFLLMGLNHLLRVQSVCRLADLLDIHFHPLLYFPTPPLTIIPDHKIDPT